MNIRNLVLSNIQINNKLIPLQFSICEKVRNKNFAFVFDEVGCGKTVEAGIVIWDAIKNGGKNILVVAPSNLTFNWYNEMLSKFGLDFKIIEGTEKAIDIYIKQPSNSQQYNVGEISNFCIVSYDSRTSDRSNAALDRLEKLDIPWDVMILDEGHGSKGEKTNRYKVLEKYRAKKVVFLSATPIKNLKEDFEKEFELVATILGNAGLSIDKIQLSAEQVIDFNLEYPVSRNFKEILLEEKALKTRIIKDIPYEIESSLSNQIQETYKDFPLLLDRKAGCIFLYDKIFSSNTELSNKYKVFKKAKFNEEDLKVLYSIDSKILALLKQVDEILSGNNDDRIVIFCYNRSVVDYLKKVLVYKYGKEYVEGIHGNTYSVEERKNKIFLLDKNDVELDSKKIVILSHNIGSVGINLSKFNHLINYQLPDTPADLEQRFGRIDRITNKKSPLTMYFFSDKNSKYDERAFGRILIKLWNEVLPMLPSKNLLFLSNKTKKKSEDLVLDLIDFEKQFILYTKKEISADLLFDKIEENEFLINFEKKINREKFKKQDKDYIESLNQFIKESKDLIFNYFNISEPTIDEIKHKINHFVDNSINYKDKNQPITLSYSRLKERMLNQKYEEYKKSILLLDNEINNLRTCLINKYEAAEDDKLGAVIEFIIEQKVNETMLFSILYSGWKVLNEHIGGISFESIIERYNKGGVFSG